MKAEKEGMGMKFEADIILDVEEELEAQADGGGRAKEEVTPKEEGSIQGGEDELKEHEASPLYKALVDEGDSLNVEEDGFGLNEELKSKEQDDDDNVVEGNDDEMSSKQEEVNPEDTKKGDQETSYKVKNDGMNEDENTLSIDGGDGLEFEDDDKLKEEEEAEQGTAHEAVTVMERDYEMKDVGEKGAGAGEGISLSLYIFSFYIIVFIV